MFTEVQRLQAIQALRRHSDPCWRMELTQTQRQVIESKARYIAVRGANRSGKTSVSAYMLSRIARRLPSTKTTSVRGYYIVFCPSRDQISSPWKKKLLEGSEVQLDDLAEKPFIPEYEIAATHYTYGGGEPTLKQIDLKNGNTIFFCVSGDKNVWKRVQGKGMVLGIVFDESAGNEKLLTEAMARLLDANSNPTIVAEAGGGWLMWGATQTEKSPAFERFLAVCSSSGDKDYAAFTLLPGENPAISQAEREKMAVILSKDEYEVRMLGHGSAATSMAVYPQWDDSRNMVASGHEYVESATDNLWLFFDPGAQYAGMVIAAVNKDNPRRLNIIKVWQPQRATLKACVQIVRDWLGGRFLEGLVYDQAARKRDMVGRSLVSELATMLSTKGTDIVVHRGLMMGRSEMKATIPLVREYLNPADGSPPLIILNRSDESGCMLLRWQIMNCAFTEKAYELKEENISRGDDHCSDALRYGVSRKPGWVDRGPNPKLWGEGTNGVDPDATMTHWGDQTAADHTIPVANVDPGLRLASERAQAAAGRRERERLKRRSVW